MKLTDSQSRAVKSDAQLLLVLAGPGSGKTAVITERIDRLLNDGIPTDKIVAITYTNAAANMLRARIAPAELAFCGTLHGFCLKLIQEYGQVIGYTGKVGVIDEEQAKELRKRCASELGYKLNAPQPLVEKRYRNELLSNGLLTFDLLLEFGLRIVQKTNLPFWHYFIDEVHDSALVDTLIYFELIQQGASTMLVADQDQSIFGFRDGYGIKTFLNQLDCAFPSCAKETMLLEENFRSDRSITRAAQQLIENDKSRTPKQTRSVSSLEGSIQFRQFDTPLAEKIYVAGMIHELGFESNTAIILRTNYLVKEWQTYLRGLGMPVEDRTSRPKPIDWRFATRLIAFAGEPENDWLAYQFLCERFGAAEADETRLQALAKGVSINTMMFKLKKHTAETIAKALANNGLSEAANSLILEALERLPVKASCQDLLLLLKEIEAEEVTTDGIVVSTYHGVKGNEFDNVFMPCFEQEIIPAKRDVLEERRIAYVGITRARHLCIVTASKERDDAFSTRPNSATVSQFAQEAGIL